MVTDIVAQDKGRYKLVTTEDADRQEILKACIDQNIRVEFFGQATTSLHDIFFRLAGAEEPEAAA